MPLRTTLAACFVLLLVGCLPVRPAYAQGTSLDPHYKNPTKATLLSVVVPGGGQLYAGERGKGLFLLLGSSAALVGGAVLSTWESDYDYTCSSGNCIDPDAYDPNYTPMIVGAGLAGALWLYGLVDASKAARRANRKRGRLASVAVAAVPVVRGGTLQPGLSMRVTF